MEKHYYWLIFIVLLTLSFRLFFAFSSPNLDHDAYFNVRQINHISHDLSPLFNDPLSFQGRTFVFTPLFHYLFAFLNLFLPSLVVFKIFPNLLASTVPILVFLIAEKITDDVNSSLVAALISSFIPIFVVVSVNSVSVYSLLFPLTLLIIYFLINIDDKKFINYFLVSILLLPFFHHFAFVIAFSFLIYLFLVMVEHLQLKREELELTLFSIFYIIWVQFIIFKRAFLIHGYSVIWQNIPDQVLSLYFAKISLPLVTLLIGFIPLAGGIYSVFRSLKDKDRNLYLIISFVISTAILLWLRLIQPDIGLAFLGILLSLLFAQGYKLLYYYLRRTNFYRLKKTIFASFVILFFITSVVPSFSLTNQRIQLAPGVAEIEALEWIGNNSGPNSTILGTLSDGHLITAVSQRKNIVDSNFLLTDNPGQRLSDVDEFFITPSKIKSLNIIEKYGIDYVLFSPSLMLDGVSSFKPLDDCYNLVFSNNVSFVYAPVCEVETNE